MNDRPRVPFLLLGGFAGVVVLNLLLRGPRTALPVAFMLGVLLSIAHLLPRALGAPSVARVATYLLLALAAALPFEAATGEPDEGLRVSVVRFPAPENRAYYELLPPAGWRGQGKPYVYLVAPGEPALVASASPILTLEGRALALERAPERPTFLRALLPEDALTGKPIRLAFGFAHPTSEVGLACTLLYASTLTRAPSTFGVDGSPPPLGAPLAERRHRLLDHLTGRARFEQPLLPEGPGILSGERGRYAIELWLLGPGGEVLATCY